MIDAPIRAYRTTARWLAFFGGLGGVAVLVSLAGCVYYGLGHGVKSFGQQAFFVGACAFFLLLGTFIVLLALRFRVEIHADRITTRELLNWRVLRRAEIIGWRVNVATTPPLIVFVHGNAAKTFNVLRMFTIDEAFLHWLQDLRDLDAEEETASLEDVLEDQHLGATPNVRADRFIQAKRLERWLTGAALVATAWGWFRPDPYAWSMGCLIVLPWLAVAIVGWSRGLFQIDRRPNDVRPTLAMLFLLPACILLLRAVLDFDLADIHRACYIMVGIAAIWSCAAFRADRSLRKSITSVLAASLYALAYGYGAGVVTNGILDHSKPTVISSRIITKQISNGDVTRYTLTIEPWRTGRSQDKVSVDRSTYETLNAGDMACVYVSDGALGIAWYTVETCHSPR